MGIFLFNTNCFEKQRWSVANVRASEPNVRSMRALRATEKHRHDRLCSLSFSSLASPLSPAVFLAEASPGTSLFV